MTLGPSKILALNQEEEDDDDGMRSDRNREGKIETERRGKYGIKSRQRHCVLFSRFFNSIIFHGDLVCSCNSLR